MSDPELVNVETACFHVLGEDLTAFVRSLWAMEEAPDKALRTLADAFPDMPEADRIAICVGSKRLEGDSRIGLTLEDDDATHTEQGASLSLDVIINRFRKRIDHLENHIALFTRNTVDIASPEGLVKIPRRKAEAYIAGKVTLNDIPHRELGTLIADGARFYDIDGEVEPESEPPLKWFLSIKTDNGWLSPGGRFYPCEYMAHMNTLNRLKLTGAAADRQGWIKIQGKEAYSSYYTGDAGMAPTQRQVDLLFDWFASRSQVLPEWLTEEMEK